MSKRMRRLQAAALLAMAPGALDHPKPAPLASPRLGRGRVNKTTDKERRARTRRRIGRHLSTLGCDPDANRRDMERGMYEEEGQ